METQNSNQDQNQSQSNSQVNDEQAKKLAADKAAKEKAEKAAADKKANEEAAAKKQKEAEDKAAKEKADRESQEEEERKAKEEAEAAAKAPIKLSFKDEKYEYPASEKKNFIVRHSRMEAMPSGAEVEDPGSVRIQIYRPEVYAELIHESKKGGNKNAFVEAGEKAIVLHDPTK